ncbi:hypothetical protein EJ377_20275 [Chryseobacterium arthrosphaerae]|uniref:Uncharacterized protein n=1 Tax=Chryseobacterium arthrosphaerae TaxID=651561 RepID=A0A3S0QFV5_9FLAO|nr:hypothetical protein EJ377_20275 [Chryseobacterium arthrosphaerae]
MNAGGIFVGEQTKVTFGTLLVPVSAKYFITEGFSVAAGLNVGIILTAKQKTVLGSDFLMLKLKERTQRMAISKKISSH